MMPERIRSISPNDRVLEVGPGANPHPRADVSLDRRFADQREAHAQRGYAPSALPAESVVWYDGGCFPFEEGEFDYVICSHVLEHVPLSELDFFVAELQRVAPRGYLEFPSVFYELINYQHVHHWFMNLHDNVITMVNKKTFTTSPLHQIYREMIYCPDQYGRGLFRRYPDLFFCGYEWFGRIKYHRLSHIEELVTDADLQHFSNYFRRQSKPQSGDTKGVVRWRKWTRAAFLPRKIVKTVA